MDWTKYPIDKLVHFVAALIPGAVILCVFSLHRPHALEAVIYSGLIGYKTKVAIIGIIAFAAGYSATTLIASLIGGLIGGIQGFRKTPFRPYDSFEVAPWRDPEWRTVVKSYLGQNAPPDTELLPEKTFELKIQSIQFLPPHERPEAEHRLRQEQLQAKLNDARWGAWYNHFHEVVLAPSPSDWILHIRHGLNDNFEAAAVLLLLCSIFTPELRQ
jgi:hypothetical protein